jgi:hypothetical protein
VAVDAHALLEHEAELGRQRAGTLVRASGTAAQEPAQVLGACQLAVQRDLARRVAGALAHARSVADELDARDGGLARVARHEAREQAQERGLAAAVGTQQPHDRAGIGPAELEIERQQRRPAAEALGQAAHADRGVRRGRFGLADDRHGWCCAGRDAE